MSLPTIDEKSTSYLTVTLLDKDEAAAQPSSATYDVYDETSDAYIKQDIALVFTLGVTEITLDADDAEILGSANYERRIVTVHALYATDDELHAEYTYRVQNLHWTPTP